MQEIIAIVNGVARDLPGGHNPLDDGMPADRRGTEAPRAGEARAANMRPTALNLTAVYVDQRVIGFCSIPRGWNRRLRNI
jgi:hypothetical protein